MTSTSRLLRQWWSASDSKLLAQSESRLLDSLVTHTHVRKKCNIGGLNVLEFNKTSSSSAVADMLTIILTHGFGSGLGFFYRATLMICSIVKRYHVLYVLTGMVWVAPTARCVGRVQYAHSSILRHRYHHLPLL